MNKRQKNILLFFLSISFFLMIAWVWFSGEIFTKTQVLIEKKDQLFGWSEKQWIDKFVPGLDLALGIIFAAAIISSILLYKYRTPKSKTELSL